MNLNKKIGFLLDTGFTPKFVSSLTESKINLLFEKMAKKETKEETTTSTTYKTFDPKGNPQDAAKLAGLGIHSDPATGKVSLTTTPSGQIQKESEKTEEEDTLNVVNDPDATADGMGMFETELSEKFESKAQQGLFWARCNKCKSDDCKWCKMAKEFSKSTSKKQYKNMPEKKHPEKTVKYKKKETKENFTFKDYLGKLGSVYTAEMAKQVKGTTPTFSESIFEKNLENIIQENLKPTMKKRDLLKLIESEIQKKKGLNEDFYFEDETELDEDLMMGGVDAPTIAPTKPKTKPSIEPDEEEYDEPMNPDEGEDPEPQAKSDEMFNKFKKRFDMDMDRMENTTHKPLRFKKF